MNQRKMKWRNSMGLWRAGEWFIVTLSAGVSFALLRLLFEYNFGKSSSTRDAVCMFFGIIVIVGVIVYVLNRTFNSYISRLTNGLRSVADGDYTVRLDLPESGPLYEAYEDFNKMAAQLQSVQTLREDFINNFSHEFKTPVTAINGFAELLSEPQITEEDRSEYLQIILDESARLADLANLTLLLSSLESKEIVPNKSPFSADEEIKRCAILLASQWEKKRIAFSVDLAELTYAGDREMLRHVWLNLMSNAIKYTPEGGEIDISLAHDGAELIFTVADTGVGMEEYVIEHAFDRYYQGDPSRRGRGQGLGLGLSVTKQIVELCGGRIEVSSAPDQGSSFTVRLPMKNAP